MYNTVRKASRKLASFKMYLFICILTNLSALTAILIMYPIKVRVSDFTFMSKDREIQNVYNCWTAVARKIKLHWKSTVTKYLFICKSRVFSRPSYPSSTRTHTHTHLPPPYFYNTLYCWIHFAKMQNLCRRGQSKVRFCPRELQWFGLETQARLFRCGIYFENVNTVPVT